jgi:hypothetical protein
MGGRPAQQTKRGDGDLFVRGLCVVLGTRSFCHSVCEGRQPCSATLGFGMVFDLPE